MLVEKSTKKDVQEFVKKASAKSVEISRGWASDKVRQKLRKKRAADFVYNFTFTIDNNKCDAMVLYRKRKNFLEPVRWDVHIPVETRRGKIFYNIKMFLGNESVYCFIITPHFLKRLGERFVSNGELTFFKNERHYIRNGRKYYLIQSDGGVIIGRKYFNEYNMYITYLSKDMCTGPNYEALLNERIDTDDVYEWIN